MFLFAGVFYLTENPIFPLYIESDITLSNMYDSNLQRFLNYNLTKITHEIPTSLEFGKSSRPSIKFYFRVGNNNNNKFDF